MSRELNANEISHLIDLALEIREGVELVNITAEERRDLESIVHLLDVLDTFWQPRVEAHAAVYGAFQQKMAQRFGETWPDLHIVSTLGDLVDTRGRELPVFSAETIEQLKSDQTPISDLLDAKARRLAVTQAMRRAQIPKTFFADFVRWVSRVLSDATASAEAGRYVVSLG